MAKKEKPTTKLCKHCKTEIPYDAKICPQCRRKVKGGKLKWVIIVLVLLILMKACSGGDSDHSGIKKVGTVDGSASSAQNDGADKAEGSQNEDADVQTVFQVGDVLMDGDVKIVYTASGEYKEDNEFLQPDEGYHYIFLNFAFENTSEKDDHSISFYSFKCYADGYACDAYYGGEEDLSATLSAGRTTTGNLYFSVPKDAKEIEVEYETNFFTEEKITFAYEGEKDSGYQPEKNTEATEDAVKVGEVVEADNLKISYLGCGVYKSDNQFIQPKKGNHFIYCEFEFENTSDSQDDEFVSGMEFDCYADGASCEGRYPSEEDLSATISAGHKAKGRVYFEVPDDAETVEVEYLTNVWTSNRIVFAYSE